jgi:hypothetical protein
MHLSPKLNVFTIEKAAQFDYDLYNLQLSTTNDLVLADPHNYKAVSATTQRVPNLPIQTGIGK